MWSGLGVAYVRRLGVACASGDGVEGAIGVAVCVSRAWVGCGSGVSRVRSCVIAVCVCVGRWPCVTLACVERARAWLPLL